MLLTPPSKMPYTILDNHNAQKDMRV